MITVKATREGIIGGKTASGYIVDLITPYVALPSPAALRQWVSLYNMLTRQGCRALVLDVGPWNVHDEAYVFQPLTLDHYGLPITGALQPQGIRPQSESGYDMTKPVARKTNGAGIDLGERVWKALGMVDNGLVSWEFD